MGELFVFKCTFFLDDRAKKDHLCAERNKFQTCFLNIGNSSGVTVVLEKKISTLIGFLLWLVYRKLVDDGENVNFDQMNTWNFACLEEILDKYQSCELCIRHLLGFKENIAAIFDYFVNPLSMS